MYNSKKKKIQLSHLLPVIIISVIIHITGMSYYNNHIMFSYHERLIFIIGNDSSFFYFTFFSFPNNSLLFLSFVILKFEVKLYPLKLYIPLYYRNIELCMIDDGFACIFLKMAILVLILTNNFLNSSVKFF